MNTQRPHLEMVLDIRHTRGVVGVLVKKVGKEGVSVCVFSRVLTPPPAHPRPSLYCYCV